MSKMATFEHTLTIKNKKIVDFYKTHPTIDFEKANMLLIHFLDSVFNHISNDLDTNINSQLLAYMNKNQNEITEIKGNISLLSDQVSKNIENTIETVNNHLISMKNEYIEEMRGFINTSNVTSGEKISNVIEKNNSHLLDKTNILLNDIIPRTSEDHQTRLKSAIMLQISELHKQIRNDVSDIIGNPNNGQSMSNFLDIFETKYNTMLVTIQQPMYSCIAASEERLNNNINTIKDMSNDSISKQKTVLDELSVFLSKYNASSNKGKYGENNLYSILTSIYPSAEVQDTTGMKASGDFILKRMEKQPILIETKDYNHNINKDEIAKFIRDIDTQNMNGIFISQYSGITFKNNYHIDIHKGNVLIYVQNCEYNPDKIRVAVDMIDYLSLKIKEWNMEETNNISKEVLDEINEEYQVFLTQRDTLQTTLKDFQKRLNSQIESLKLPSLDKYLDTKYAYVRERNFTCDICNAFTGTNKQSLSAHKRGCRKKNAATCIVAENSTV